MRDLEHNASFCAHLDIFLQLVTAKFVNPVTPKHFLLEWSYVASLWKGRGERTLLQEYENAFTDKLLCDDRTCFFNLKEEVVDDRRRRGWGGSANEMYRDTFPRHSFFMLSIYTALQVAVLQEDHRFGQALCRHRVDWSCGCWDLRLLGGDVWVPPRAYRTGLGEGGNVVNILGKGALSTTDQSAKLRGWRWAWNRCTGDDSPLRKWFRPGVNTVNVHLNLG